MKSYINIHSHKTCADNDTLTLLNLYDDFDRVAGLDACSIGLHPWHLNGAEANMRVIERLAALPQVLAIGECGLDKVCETPWDLQEDFFRRQVTLANRVNKPLIIHCVRAYDEAIVILKDARVPAIFHGFQKNPELAKQLTDHGFYLSFGKATDSLSSVPADRFFLETDNSNVSIKEIYETAAALRGISKEELTSQLQQNFKTVFGK